MLIQRHIFTLAICSSSLVSSTGKFALKSVDFLFSYVKTQTCSRSKVLIAFLIKLFHLSACYLHDCIKVDIDSRFQHIYDQFRSFLLWLFSDLPGSRTVIDLFRRTCEQVFITLLSVSTLNLASNSTPELYEIKIYGRFLSYWSFLCLYFVIR